MEHGEDWISFKHELNSDIGYSYLYTKIIRLKSNGFTIDHSLQNTGAKVIETDQFNHNFLMIDGKHSGPDFTISFPYPISTEDDPQGFLEVKDSAIHFIKELVNDDAVFVLLNGYSDQVSDHQVTVENTETGAGVTYTVDKPLYRMAFWACRTTLSPENSIWISVEPGKEDQWRSEYTIFVN
jgi:hypothetical protein